MIGPLYSGALRHGRRLEAIYPDGTRVCVPVDDWRGPLLPGDAGLLERCTGATLDVGCGPGRLAVALRHRGLLALGIDINAEAVRLARRAGAAARQRSVFGDVPRAGRWDTVLLADGNIGIGGLPVVLLRRVAALLSPRGHVLLEVDGPEANSCRTRLRLASGDRVSLPFPWAHLALRDADGAAALAGLRVDESWQQAGRWFVGLQRETRNDATAEIDPA